MSKIRKELPPLGTLVAFDAAYRLQSFSRAADEIALSQASVSRQIRELENNIGLPLFERRRHDVAPTPAGEVLAGAVRLSLQELAATATRLRTEATSGTRLTVYSDFSIASFLITPALDRFQQHNPELQIRMVTSYEPIEEYSEDFDIGFQASRMGESRFHVDPIADDEVFPVCSPIVAARLPQNPTALDLASQPLLHLEDIGRDWPDWRQFLAKYRLKQPYPIEGLTFNSYQICLEAAENGHGIALGWGRSVQTKLDHSHLVRIPGMSMPVPEAVFVYRHRSRSAEPIVERFLETIRAGIEPVGEQIEP